MCFCFFFSQKIKRIPFLNSGVKYLNECPIQPNLPVYLLVAGAIGLVRVLNLLWKQFRRRRRRKLEGVELDQEEEAEDSLYFFKYSSLYIYVLLPKFCFFI